MIGAKIDGKRYADFVNALCSHDKVIVQKTAEDGSFARLGYIGVFRFDKLEIGEDGSISLRLVERLPIRPAN